MNEKNQLSQSNFERIEAYLLNRMPEKEKQTFLEDLKTNKRLKDELDLQRKLITTVEAGAFKEKLDAVHRRMIRRKKQIWWISVAASVAILLSFSIWLLNRPTQYERLFTENLTIEPGLPLPMSAVDDYDFYDAMVDYKSGEYKIAEKKWMKLLKKEPENDTLNYFIGIALFNSEEYLKAEPYFIKVIKLNSSTYTGKSEWYLALSYLKTGETDKLRQLSKNSHSDYSQRINQIILKIE